MLKHRIEKLERSTRAQQLNPGNVDRIYRFYLTGNEEFLPDQSNLNEVKVAARRIREKGIKKCLGLLRTYKAFKTTGEMSDKGEDAFFDCIEALGPESREFRFCFEGDRPGGDQLLEKLGLLKSYKFDFEGPEEPSQN